MTTSLDDSRRTKKTPGRAELAAMLVFVLGSLSAAITLVMLAHSPHA